jgi:hypothetical protein
MEVKRVEANTWKAAIEFLKVRCTVWRGSKGGPKSCRLWEVQQDRK